jgi:vancomycin permeability regulator SanA
MGERFAAWRRHRRRIVTVVLAVAGGLLIVVGGPAAWVRVQAVGKTYPVADVPERPVAIVFGAGLDPDGSPSAFLRYRLDIAADLFQRGKVAVVLVSGDNRTIHYDEPTAMLDHLVAKGVPEERIVRDYAGRDTYDTCVRAHRVFSVPAAILVTQGYHLPRALAVCNAVGVPSVGVPDTQAAQRFPAAVRVYTVREYAADIKAVWDVVSGRNPVLGEKESAVTDALIAAGP